MSQTYWIVFKEGQAWWSFILKKGWEHCFILTQENGSWLVLDPTRRKLSAEILYYSQEYNFSHLLRTLPSTNILQITMHHPKAECIVHSINFFTCVTIVKYFLGLRLFCITPWQLWKRLHKLRNNTKRKYELGIESIRFLF